MSAPLAIFYILVIFYGSINIVILGFIKGDLATGYYSAAFKIIDLFFYVPASVAGAALPVLSRSWKDSHQVFHQVYQKCARYLLLLAIPLAVGTFLLGERAIILLFGRDYLPSVALIKILALCLLPDFLNYIMSAALISMNREKVAVIAALIGAVVALVSCLIFIPIWGAVGAVGSLAVSFSAVFFFQFCALFRQFRVLATFVTAARAVVAGGLMGLGLVCFTAIGMPLPLLVGLSFIVYSGALLLFAEVKYHEVKFGYQLLRDLGKSLIVSRVSHQKIQGTYR
jgi:O-antigen/teichoic acid export membrane protein